MFKHNHFLKEDLIYIKFLNPLHLLSLFLRYHRLKQQRLKLTLLLITLLLALNIVLMA